MKENTVSVTKLTKLFLSHIVPILISGVVCAGIVGGYLHFFATPTYKTSASALVNNGGLSYDTDDNPINTGTLSASMSLVATCVDMLNSDKIYVELSNEVNNKYSWVELQRMFHVSGRSEDSLLIDIVVQGEDKKDIVTLSNTFLEIMPEFVKTNLPPTDVRIMSDSRGVWAVGPGVVPSCLLGFLGGVALCYFIFFLISQIKNTIDSESDFKEIYDIPILGTVPFFEAKANGGKRNAKNQKE